MNSADKYLSSESTITSKAMIARLSISQYKPSIVDRDATSTVHQKYMAKNEAGAYRKVLIKKDAYNDISKVINESRAFHYKQTLPWGEHGERLLPATNYVEYISKMSEYKQQFQDAVNQFIAEYPNLVAEAQTRLGSMFDQDNYKDVNSISDDFAFRIEIKPIATADDFRVNIAQEDVETIKKDIREKVENDQAEAMKDLWNRLHSAVARMSERLTETRIDKKTNKERPAIFHKSMVENLIELSQLLPKLNIKNDPNLDKMCADVQDQLCSFPASELRKTSAAREETARAAKKIMDKMSIYMGE